MAATMSWPPNERESVGRAAEGLRDRWYRHWRGLRRAGVAGRRDGAPRQGAHARRSGARSGDCNARTHRCLPMPTQQAPPRTPARTRRWSRPWWRRSSSSGEGSLPRRRRRRGGSRPRWPERGVRRDDSRSWPPREFASALGRTVDDLYLHLKERSANRRNPLRQQFLQ